MTRTGACKDRTKKFFDKVHTFFKTIYKGAQDFIDNNIEPALEFVKAFKLAVDSPAADFIVNMNDWKWDNALLKVLRSNLGQVIDILELQLECGKEASLEDKIACYLQYLRTCSPELRDALYHKTAALLTRLSDDKKRFTNAEIDAMVQLTYTQLKSK